MNLWNNPAGVFDFQHSLFTARAKAAAYETGAYFVDHEAAAAALQKVLGEAGTRLNWIGDNIHLTDRGSINVAGAYARAVICADAPLMLHIKTDRSKLPRYCSPDQVPAQTSRAGKRARFY
ncbi:uncharacterized protein L969DRAFT_68894 [Mixia osmundae IAM 14324]|uniref:SGNH hydrolase-type esterase domain-containing protein n=1 Tax=Mixia osmundae (strain CBS 9802 / IAM 14324 / JCM 22182 / KY 12970) TaxID=764103 RepID=G7DZW2_MIXOS|nr:uncharacterized protein L969DRAFT_68894 [Mixia osmundae IAM 14324]KEI42115.1 hypothetical protein L969DRAFT_68894 [Mixia osmundae IAM 14324]GAA96122.1 hypothetical protein E5Q_02783 [Mixia osmundae IAM 14324]